MLSRTRQRQHDNIIANAKALFISKGIHDTSMNDIAQHANIERKTIYNYFSTKEELATAVVMSLEELDRFYYLGEQDFDNEINITGYDMLESVILTWAREYHRFGDALVLEHQYEHIFKEIVLFKKAKKDAAYIENTPISKSIRKGISDKSIHFGDMDWMQLVCTVTKCLKTIIQKKLTQYGHIIEGSHPCSSVEESFKIILRGLKA